MDVASARGDEEDDYVSLVGLAAHAHIPREDVADARVQRSVSGVALTCTAFWNAMCGAVVALRLPMPRSVRGIRDRRGYSWRLSASEMAAIVADATAMASFLCALPCLVALELWQDFSPCHLYGDEMDILEAVLLPVLASFPLRSVARLDGLLKRSVGATLASMARLDSVRLVFVPPKGNEDVEWGETPVVRQVMQASALRLRAVSFSVAQPDLRGWLDGVPSMPMLRRFQGAGALSCAADATVLAAACPSLVEVDLSDGVGCSWCRYDLAGVDDGVLRVLVTLSHLRVLCLGSDTRTTALGLAALFRDLPLPLRLLNAGTPARPDDEDVLGDGRWNLTPAGAAAVTSAAPTAAQGARTYVCLPFSPPPGTLEALVDGC